jgi:hypothetical protein
VLPKIRGISSFRHRTRTHKIMMWAAASSVARSTAASRSASRRLVNGGVGRRAPLATQVEGAGAEKGEGPIGEDGRHEIWRENIYDHDNEPRYDEIGKEKNGRRKDTFP